MQHASCASMPQVSQLNLNDACRLLRWGTSTAAELAADADLAAQPRLLRWGTSTAADLAAADAAYGQKDQQEDESAQQAHSPDDWTGVSLAELARQESMAASAGQGSGRPAAKTASRSVPIYAILPCAHCSCNPSAVCAYICCS